MHKKDRCGSCLLYTSVNDQMNAASRELDRIWYEGEDVETVMTDLAAEVDEMLEKDNKRCV